MLNVPRPFERNEGGSLVCWIVEGGRRWSTWSEINAYISQRVEDAE